MQIALARLTGDPFVVIDRADVLDAKTREQLFALLKKASKAGIGSIVGMTQNQPISTLAQQALGISHSYWIENGVCTGAVAVPV